MDSKIAMNSCSERQHWMATLAKAPLPDLLVAKGQLGELPAYSLLRAAETGLVMVRGRAGGTGCQFNLGEVTLTRCVVQVMTASSPVGFGYVMGRSKPQAEVAAVCDGLLQDPEWHDLVMHRVIEPLDRQATLRKQQQQAQTAATQVNFFAMVRGAS